MAGMSTIEAAIAPQTRSRDRGRYAPRHRAEKPSLLRTSAGGFAVGFVLAAVAALAASLFLVRPFQVPSESMTPTIQPGSTLLASVPGVWDVRRGDVVVIADPGGWGDGGYVVKRVVGLPGDLVQVTSRGLLVNGFAVDEPYTLDGPGAPFEAVVPQDHLFVAGDNRDGSGDSRVFGAVDRSLLVAVAFLVAGPEWGWLDGRDVFASVPPPAAMRR